MTGKKTIKKKGKTQAACRCPYCDTEVMVVHFPFCKTCGLEIRRCTSCMVVVPQDAKICPNCGQAIE